MKLIESLLLIAVIALSLFLGARYAFTIAEKERKEMLECLAGLDSRCSISSVYEDHDLDRKELL